MKNKNKVEYKGWKSGVRSKGWVLLQKRDPETDRLHIIEEKTIGKVTMQRHGTDEGPYWIVNGKTFKKLKEAVAYADGLSA